MWKIVGAILGVFLPLSFFTIGGGQAVIAEVQRQVVDVHHWMTPGEFINLFAISRMAPGPGSLYITLIGWQVAGLAGAVAATIGIFLPTMIVTYVIAGIWSRYEKTRWQRAFESGLKPVAAGLVLSSVYVLITNLNGALFAQAIALASTGALVLTRLHPLLLLALGGVTFLIAHQYFGV
jgi:chromate transporter